MNGTVAEGRGANALGDPRLALTWLANELSGLGITLAAGQVVTTGTCVVPMPVGPGVEVVADLGILGANDDALHGVGNRWPPTASTMSSWAPAPPARCSPIG